MPDWIIITILLFLIASMFALQVADAMSTYIGIKLGFGREGNARLVKLQVLFRRVSNARWLWLVGPKLAVLACVLIGGAALMVTPVGHWHWLSMMLLMFGNLLYFLNVRSNLHIIVGE